ncbi:membrane protein [Rickettsiales bacterium Ac37b]|nr:membrane protein [Rickettsiales bacterium Ac37b]
MLEFLGWITDFVHKFGYIGIFIMTFIESTFIPLPAEITLVPAGYLISTGEMNLYLVLIYSIAGTVGGSWLSYWIALHYGRNLIIKYGKYFFMNEQKLKKIESFFARHGNISTFTGRFLPGVKHYISFPAGLAQMPIKPFLTYTFLGSSIWVVVLLSVGYFIGSNQDTIKKYLMVIKLAMILLIAIIIIVYIILKSWNKRNQTKL